MTAGRLSNTRHALVGGKSVQYHDTGGEGEPLLLIHGGGMGASGSSNYSRNIETLSRTYRLIVPDLPGYGGSYKDLPQEPRYAHYTRALLGLLDDLGVPKAHVVGNSLGGGVALMMALEAPQRVGKLILMGPAGLSSAYSSVPTEGIRMIFEYYGGSGPSREKLQAFLKLMIHDPSNLTEELFEERYQASIQPDLLASPPFGRGPLPILEEIWRDPRLARLPHETLVLWGRDDRVNLLSTADILVNQLPRARTITFNKCGHWVQWERARAFNSLVAAFIADEF